jgi:preprotein translocase subunit SecD
VSHRGASSIVNRLRFLLLVCVFAGTTLAAAFAQSIAVEIVSAEAAYDQATGKPVVAFRMDPASARAFAELTTTNIGRPAALIIDGQVMSKPIIRSPITGGAGQISGDFDTAGAQALARRLIDHTSKLTIEIVSDGSPGK